MMRVVMKVGDARSASASAFSTRKRSTSFGMVWCSAWKSRTTGLNADTTHCQCDTSVTSNGVPNWRLTSSAVSTPSICVEKKGSIILLLSGRNASSDEHSVDVVRVAALVCEVCVSVVGGVLILRSVCAGNNGAGALLCLLELFC